MSTEFVSLISNRSRPDRVARRPQGLFYTSFTRRDAYEVMTIRLEFLLFHDLVFLLEGSLCDATDGYTNVNIYIYISVYTPYTLFITPKPLVAARISFCDTVYH